MPFNLLQSTEILRSKYEAPWVHPLDNQNGLNAEVGLDLGNKLLHIEFSVEFRERRVRITAVYTTEIPSGPIQPLQHLEQVNETSTYVHDPRVINRIERVKQDIGVADFTTV